MRLKILNHLPPLFGSRTGVSQQVCFRNSECKPTSNIIQPSSRPQYHILVKLQQSFLWFVDLFASKRSLRCDNIDYNMDRVDPLRLPPVGDRKFRQITLSKGCLSKATLSNFGVTWRLGKQRNKPSFCVAPCSCTVFNLLSLLAGIFHSQGSVTSSPLITSPQKNIVKSIMLQNFRHISRNGWHRLALDVLGEGGSQNLDMAMSVGWLTVSDHHVLLITLVTSCLKNYTSLIDDKGYRSILCVCARYYSALFHDCRVEGTQSIRQKGWSYVCENHMNT